MAIILNNDTNKQNTDNTSCNNNNNDGTGNNTFYCEPCDIAFNKKASFDKHLLSTKHSDSNSKGFVKGFEHEQQIHTGTGAGFTCDKCTKNYKYKASFFTHVKNCGKGESGGIENTATATTTTVQALASVASSNMLASSTNLTSDTTLLLVNEIGTMMKTMSQIVTTLDLTIVTLNKMYNNNK